MQCSFLLEPSRNSVEQFHGVESEKGGYSFVSMMAMYSACNLAPADRNITVTFHFAQHFVGCVVSW